MLVDAQLQLSPRDDHGPGNVSGSKGFPLTDIKQSYAGLIGGQAPIDLRQRHKRHVVGGLVDQLRDGFPTAEVGSQGLGQVVGIPEGNRAHFFNEVGAVRELQSRVLLDFLANGCLLYTSDAADD